MEPAIPFMSQSVSSERIIVIFSFDDMIHQEIFQNAKVPAAKAKNEHMWK